MQQLAKRPSEVQKEVQDLRLEIELQEKVVKGTDNQLRSHLPIYDRAGRTFSLSLRQVNRHV